jgi:hypothetical protein
LWNFQIAPEGDARPEQPTAEPGDAALRVLDCPDFGIAHGFPEGLVGSASHLGSLLALVCRVAVHQVTEMVVHERCSKLPAVARQEPPKQARD